MGFDGGFSFLEKLLGGVIAIVLLAAVGPTLVTNIADFLANITAQWSGASSFGVVVWIMLTVVLLFVVIKMVKTTK